jgi:hypothetical protein
MRDFADKAVYHIRNCIGLSFKLILPILTFLRNFAVSGVGITDKRLLPLPKKNCLLFCGRRFHLPLPQVKLSKRHKEIIRQKWQQRNAVAITVILMGATVRCGSRRER